MRSIFSSVFGTHLQPTLVILTMAGALAFIVIACVMHKTAVEKRRLTLVTLATAAVAASLIGSYGTLLHPGTAPPQLGSLLNPFTLFLLNVLVTLLAFFLIVIVVIGLLDPWRAEITAKLLGAEFSYKMKYRQSLDQYEREADETNQLLTRTFEAFKDLEDWAGVIFRLNAAVLSYLDSPYLEMLASAADPPSAVRRAVKDVLVDAYADMRDSVAVHVAALNDREIEAMGEVLAARIRLSLREEAGVTTIKNGTGIAVHYREGGFDTAIVLEGRGGYEVTPAEIAAASTLFVAVADAVIGGLHDRVDPPGE